MWDLEGEDDYPSPRASFISVTPSSSSPNLPSTAVRARDADGHRPPSRTPSGTPLNSTTDRSARVASYYRNERDFGWSDSAGGVRSGYEAPGSAGYYMERRRKRAMEREKERERMEREGVGRDDEGEGKGGDFVNRSASSKKKQFLPVFAPSAQLPEIPDNNDPPSPSGGGPPSPNGGLGRKTSLRDRVTGALKRGVGSLRRPDRLAPVDESAGGRPRAPPTAWKGVTLTETILPNPEATASSDDIPEQRGARPGLGRRTQSIDSTRGVQRAGSAAVSRNKTIHTPRGKETVRLPPTAEKEEEEKGLGGMVRKLSRRATTGGGARARARRQMEDEALGKDVIIMEKEGKARVMPRRQAMGGGPAAGAGERRFVQPGDRLSRHWQNIDIPDIPLFKPPPTANVPNAMALSSFAPRGPLRPNPRGASLPKEKQQQEEKDLVYSATPGEEGVPDLPVPVLRKEEGRKAPNWEKFERGSLRGSIKEAEG